ncbi:unnamed protein product [Meloidogyne enterolobii]|uniref:Uncharacterized protein n=1 Tax=Meloidogyne enterolobii TaxID=390850 RepID=A0ACB1AJG6_MELEN
MQSKNWIYNIRLPILFLYYLFCKIWGYGLLIECEDMFPYKGKLANAINGDAYTMDETTILAWHDMLVHMSDRDSEAFNLSKILKPILWSYAEDLDMYLPYSDWLALKKFK